MRLYWSCWGQEVKILKKAQRKALLRRCLWRMTAHPLKSGYWTTLDLMTSVLQYMQLLLNNQTKMRTLLKERITVKQVNIHKNKKIKLNRQTCRINLRAKKNTATKRISQDPQKRRNLIQPPTLAHHHHQLLQW